MLFWMVNCQNLRWKFQGNYRCCRKILLNIELIYFMLIGGFDKFQGIPIVKRFRTCEIPLPLANLKTIIELTNILGAYDIGMSPEIGLF